MAKQTSNPKKNEIKTAVSKKQLTDNGKTIFENKYVPYVIFLLFWLIFFRELITTNKEVAKYDFYHPHNIFILDDMETFIDEKNKTHELFFTKKFIGSIFNATFRLDETDPFIIKEKEEDYKERIKNTEELFNNFCTFNFFDKIIISHMPKEGDIYGATFSTSDS